MPETNSTQESQTHKHLEKLIEEHKKLLTENNKILKKLHRVTMATIWLKLLWYVILIGLPFALYFYFLEPYFTALGSDYETFKAGIGEIPGLKSIDTLINGD